MKNLLAVTLCLILFASGMAQADVNTISVTPSMVPDETEPRVNYGDAPPGFGPDSWQGPVAGLAPDDDNKTNWHARYQADGDYLSALFPDDAATMTIDDLAEISYWTKRPDGTPPGRDWWIQIYTRPQAGDSWYHDRFINNYSDHSNTGDWVNYTTGSGMTFHANGGISTLGVSTLVELKAAAGDQLIEMISVQTNSAWNGFDGYMDGLVITLENGNVGRVNFTPVPGAFIMGAMGLGMVGWLKRRKGAKVS